MRIKVCHWHSFGGLVDSENWNGALPKEDIDIKDGFDALLGYNIITTEFINFKGPKLFISGEPLRYLDDFTRDMLHILPEKHIWAYWKGNMEERAFPYGTLSDFALFKFSEEIKENCNKKRPKKICFINNYKYQGTRECAHDLQSSRDSLVLEFAKQGVEVDVYGRNWEKSLLNKSTLLINNGMTYNKLNILKK